MTSDLLTFNGEPIITIQMMHNIELDGRLYFQEDAGSEDCSCRRCSLHDDFGGCVVEEAMWGLVLWMIDPVGTFDEFADDGESAGCDLHGSQRCSDPICIRRAGGSVLAAELADAERWA